MRRHMALVQCSLLVVCLTSSVALGVDYTRDGTIELATPQIGNTSDGFTPGRAWESVLLLPSAITLNAGDTLQGTIGFGSQLLRVRDNGNGFFRVGMVTGFEQLIVLATVPGMPSQITQEDNTARFTDGRGPVLALGGSRVGGVNHNGVFMQVVVNMVGTGEEFLASGINYRLGLVSGGPFTITRVDFRVLAEEIGIEARPPGDLAYRTCLTGEMETGPDGADSCAPVPGIAQNPVDSGLNNLRSLVASADGTSVYTASAADDAVAHFERDPDTGVLTYRECLTGAAESGPSGSGACEEVPTASQFGENSGLDVLQGLAMSPDGRSLYAAAVQDDAIARFSRDPETGVIAFSDCITGKTMGAEPACTEIDAASANGTDSGLDGVRAVAVSPDGKSLYAVAPEDDAVAVFDRDPATGILTYQGCLTGETQSGDAACTAIPSATDNGIDSGLDMPFALALSPDGTSSMSRRSATTRSRVSRAIRPRAPSPTRAASPARSPAAPW